MRVLVVQHQDSCPPARVGEWLRAKGVTLHLLRPDRGEQVPADLASVGADGLVVLGGEMGATDDERAPWLPATRDLVARSAQERAPVLGVCLGHQLASVALGGRVARHPGGRTLGIRGVERAGDAGDDPLAAALPASTVVPQWNDDVVLHPPPGSRTLATNDRGDVALARLAETVWGTQGHPEATREVVAGWAGSDVASGTLDGVAPEDLPAVLDEVDHRADDVERGWRPVLEAWADLLGAR